MKNKRNYLLVVLILCFVTLSSAQRRKAKGTVNIVNGFSIGGGITSFDILTDNFSTIEKDGWIVNMSATVEIPHKWFNVSYGMQLSENNIGIASKPLGLTLSDTSVDYKVFTAQVVFLWHIKLLSEYVTLDVGPMLQYNSDLEIKDDTYENAILDGYTTVTADNIKDINNFNVNGAVGITAGFSHLKVRAQYIYGFTNILGNLNNNDFSDNIDKKFKGNQSMLALTAMFSF
ncbi:hypothetical protein [Aurantibacter aestuarii]|uniref:Outer membrane protein beta-barrel domain-containing protein n=1 Tax=Aurantibacter aestuarii TaxID=1266046 RepID=A0A2T1NCX8_9FLAO|nr:hypothetical protein [Aurantibacter aestuarii]PSG90298.1 hypothetical protein C7H52_03180 [Aurantibacter aestuarii]